MSTGDLYLVLIQSSKVIFLRSSLNFCQRRLLPCVTICYADLLSRLTCVSNQPKSAPSNRFPCKSNTCKCDLWSTLYVKKKQGVVIVHRPSLKSLITYGLVRCTKLKFTVNCLALRRCFSNTIAPSYGYYTYETQRNKLERIQSLRRAYVMLFNIIGIFTEKHKEIYVRKKKVIYMRKWQLSNPEQLTPSYLYHIRYYSLCED